MGEIIIKPKAKNSAKGFDAIFSVPGDKSISHRAVMFGALTNGRVEVNGFLNGDDCIATIDCFREMGVEITHSGEKVVVNGVGMRGLKKPDKPLYVGNSGTTIRLLSGILAAQDFDCVISGDASIVKRPMGRVIKPLSQMGADIKGIGDNGELNAPLQIRGRQLHGIEYVMPVPSAQVKSAIILSSLYADSPTTIKESVVSRDHTEIMLNYFGANITSRLRTIVSKPIDELFARPVDVPGDISSAAFFIVAALIVPNSKLIITNVGVNVTRMGIVTALLEMGADIEIVNKRLMGGEWVADIIVKSSKLHATVLEGSIIPRMIDEIPIFAIAALFAEGTTVIKNAEELKVKESNRIAAMVTELKKMGATISETDDGMEITGGSPLHGAEVESYNDHRVAMSLAVAALTAESETKINNSECVSVSYPDFYDIMLSM